MPKSRKTQERKEIIKTIENAARVYKDQLVGKTFLYVFDGRYIEVMFKAENFKHLTGVDSSLSAKRFLKLAVHNMLGENQISFSSRHPYALCKKKLGHITEIASFASSESFMLEEISTNSFTYKFGTSDLNFTLCMGEDLDSYGIKKSRCLVAQSLRDGDCFSKSKNVYAVSHILMKKNDEKLYGEVCFLDKTLASDPIPDFIRNHVSEVVLSKFSEAVVKVT